FGNKEALFRTVVARYIEGPAACVVKALEQPTARAVGEQLLGAAVDLVTDSQHPRGCLLGHGALVCGEAGGAGARGPAGRREAREVALRMRCERARAEGDLPPSANPADLARYIMTVLRGLSVEAAGGASRRELRRVVDVALRALPKRRRPTRARVK